MLSCDNAKKLIQLNEHRLTILKDISICGEELRNQTSDRDKFIYNNHLFEWYNGRFVITRYPTLDY